jgi:hypothetical protein
LRTLLNQPQKSGRFKRVRELVIYPMVDRKWVYSIAVFIKEKKQCFLPVMADT